MKRRRAVSLLAAWCAGPIGASPRPLAVGRGGSTRGRRPIGPERARAAFSPSAPERRRRMRGGAAIAAPRGTAAGGPRAGDGRRVDGAERDESRFAAPANVDRRADPTATEALESNSTDPTAADATFKSSLLTGLELQAAAHRTRLLSDLLEGAKGGIAGAVDTEKERAWLGEEKARFWRFWRRGAASAAASDPPDRTDAAASDGKAGPRSPEPSAASRPSEFASRTITGLVSALAREVRDLRVAVDADPTTPLSDKAVHSVRICFRRLGFPTLRMGGADAAGRDGGRITADEAFGRIDADDSGGLDSEELASALETAAVAGNGGGGDGGSGRGGYLNVRSREMLSEIAARLVRLYDANGDGVVDREEYGVMVKDMAVLREMRLVKGDVNVGWEGGSEDSPEKKRGWFGRLFGRKNNSIGAEEGSVSTREEGKLRADGLLDVTENEVFWSLVDQGEGSIVLEDLRLDLRRLLFGAIPVAKRILPGGPLVLKPFTATVTASFDREDIMDSFLIDAGLRRLVARALSRRVRGLRDIFDGAVFYGRTWKLFEQNAPLVEVPKLQDVQFDKRNRLIITGRARIKAAPDAPSIENGFKLRTKIGTRANGRIIGLLQPEIAVFAECPKGLEKNVRRTVKDWFDYTIPTLQPLYMYIPLVSPLKKNDKMDGFNLGEDNQIKYIEIKNGKLCFQMSAILRPGRFLGNHCLAFTVPIRTLIITLDRVKEGMRNARRNKREADKAARQAARLAKQMSKMDAACDDECAIDEVLAQSLSGKPSISNEGRDRLQKLESELKAVEDENESKDNNAENQKSFIGRFVEGYSAANCEDEDVEMNARLSSSISDFFGSQDSEEVT